MQSIAGPLVARRPRITAYRLADGSSDLNPILLWVPSQNGLLFDPPHRQRAIIGIVGIA